LASFCAISALSDAGARTCALYVPKEADRRHAGGARQPGFESEAAAAQPTESSSGAAAISPAAQVLVDLLLDQGDLNRDSIFWHSFGRKPPH
jgi:hypothetical protein